LDENLPYILQRAANLHNKFSIKIYNFATVEELKTIIEHNKIDLFE